jgi:DNA-binding MarR family transcriptional regulator
MARPVGNTNGVEAEIRAALARAEQRLRAADIAALLGRDWGAVKRNLDALVERGEVTRQYVGRVALYQRAPRIAPPAPREEG